MIERILYNLNEPYRTAALLLTYTGLRFGEMAGLHWADLHQESRRIDVRLTWQPDLRTVKAYPKNRNNRALRIPARVLEALNRPDDWREPCGLVHADGKSCLSGLVITGPNGAPLNDRNMRNRHCCRPSRQRGLEHGRQHDLRHTFATWLAEAGVQMDHIAALLGHSSTVVTKRYRHLAPTYGDQALAVGNVLVGRAGRHTQVSLLPRRGGRPSREEHAFLRTTSPRPRSASQ